MWRADTCVAVWGSGASLLVSCLFSEKERTVAGEEPGGPADGRPDHGVVFHFTVLASWGVALFFARH